jgi:hypothetical protein
LPEAANPANQTQEVVMYDLRLEFWTGGLAILLGSIGLYLAVRADDQLQEIHRQVKAMKRILRAQRA